MPATLLPFLLFAMVASITPGPTNILILSNSARFGLLAVVPSVLGACGGAALLVLAVGTGLGESLLTLPGVHLAMTSAGLLWLTWLAWKIYTSPASALHASDNSRRLGLVGAAGLQVVNPKTWMMALAVISVFTTAHHDRNTEVAWLSLAFFLVALPCMACWALLGAGSARWLRSPAAISRMNKTLAVILLISAWSSLFA
jgi:threonine/homoserine/homoserine lactone efflux protein